MTEFKSTQDRINKTIDLINSKLTNHPIKIKHSRPHKYIISTQGNNELSIFDVSDKDPEDILKMLELLNNNIKLFDEKLRVIHVLHNTHSDFNLMNETSIDGLNMTKIESDSYHQLHPEESNAGWQIEQIARFEIKHKGKNKLDIHAVIELTNHAAEYIKEVEKEINGKTFAVTREIKTDSWHLAMSNIYKITIKDVKLDDIVATIQELTEITLDDFRMMH